MKKKTLLYYSMAAAEKIVRRQSCRRALSKGPSSSCLPRKYILCGWHAAPVILLPGPHHHLRPASSGFIVIG